MKRTTKNGDSMFQVNFSLPPLQKASYAKNSSGGNSPSSSIQDIRPTFLIARVFGLAPYAITNSSINVSKRGILYSVPWLGFYLYALYNRLNLYTHSDLETKFRILSVTRTALAVIALLVDLVVCTFRDDRFQSALDCVRKYDLAVKYDVETNARLMRIHSWTVYSFMITYYLAIGWFTYFNEPYEGVMAAVIYVYLYLPLSIAVMKFVALITSILLRFRHLHRMLFPGFLSIMMELDSEPKRLHLRDVCWLHSCLCAAAANVNSLYSLQLMLWFANLMFNTISRINDFGQPQNNIDAFKLARDAGLVLIFVTLVFFIAGVCHVTSTQANKVGAVVFSPGSRYFRSRVAEHQDKEDKFCIGQYFALHPLHFSAASGFFRINLSLLLKGGIMVNLSDIKPLFYAARFFGCAPHRVTDSDILLTTTGLIYSGIWALGFVCCCCYGLLLICADAHTGERNILALTAVRTLLAYVCFFADDALTMRWNERLRSALLQLRNFDLAVGYGRKRSVNWKLRCCCWMLVGTIIAYWIGVGYFTYKCEMTNPLFNAITYVIANAAISMQLIKFAGLLMLLRQRFRYLRELLPSEAHPNSARRAIQLQDIWWLHCSLANAAETINSCFSLQLLLWIFTMWLNALSRIYAMNETLVGSGQFLLMLRESLLVTACIGNLILIALACHYTAREANSVGRAVFAPQASVSRKRSLLEHSLEVGVYFSLRQLHFSAAGGFIQVDLPLLLSIAGAMTTYLVVLHNNS